MGGLRGRWDESVPGRKVVDELSRIYIRGEQWRSGVVKGQNSGWGGRRDVLKDKKRASEAHNRYLGRMFELTESAN